jgi:high-affinity nickel permease
MITLVSIVALGFFLGMRHATDPDHVIAVTMIVSRQRSIRNAALIGAYGASGTRSRFSLSVRQSSCSV